VNNSWDLTPVLLLTLSIVALGIGLLIVVMVIRRARHNSRAPAKEAGTAAPCLYQPTCSFRRPGCWLAVKSRNLLAVQTALGLHNAKACSWKEGLAGEEQLFIAPPVNGWVLVMGSSLPDPSDDVDACFRFVVGVSRKLGQVQFFSVNRVLHYHAWVKADAGRVIRAYAWAGRTLWQQGLRTSAENDLKLKCFDYSEPAERTSFSQPDVLAANDDKVPLLAARWSLDPARIDERFLEQAHGIAGELSRRY
jgi:hypothetical protein